MNYCIKKYLNGILKTKRLLVAFNNHAYKITSQREQIPML